VETWIIVLVVAGVTLVTAATLITLSRSVFRGPGLSFGSAWLGGLAAEWERDRALMTAVLREDLQTLSAAASGSPAAAEELRAAERAVDLFAANEQWADNMRAATTAMGRANRALTAAETPPCLFNPVHGPSAAEVEWGPGGGSRRRVPVCAADAARLRAGDPPLVRMVQTDEGVVPYYASHGRYVDWLLGWYDGFDPYLTARLLAGTTIGGHLPGRIRAIHGTASDPLGEFGRVHD
jgi:hypothetical protein